MSEAGATNDVTGEEAAYVERIRENLRAFDRWRWAFAAFHGALLLVVIGLGAYLAQAADMFERMFGAGAVGIPAGTMWLVFLIGGALGIKLGMILQHAAWGLATALWDDLRVNRLMLKYHDALRNTNDAPRDDEDAILGPGA